MTSSYHEKVTSLLDELGISYQEEVSPADLFPDRKDLSKLRYDIVLTSLGVIIEVHGEQHAKIVTFGASAEEALSAHYWGRRHDRIKKEVAQLAGWSYIEVWFHEIKKLNAQELYQKLLPAIESSSGGSGGRDSRDRGRPGRRISTGWSFIPGVRKKISSRAFSKKHIPLNRHK